MEMPDIARETWAAIGGGVVGAIVDRGPFLKRAINGCGAVIVAMVFAPAVSAVLPAWAQDARINAGVAAAFAIVGVILAETLQRIARRALRNPEAIGDKIRDKIDKRIDDA